MNHLSAFLHELGRFAAIAAFAAVLIFTISLAVPEKTRDRLCNIHTAECYDQLGRR